MTTNQSICKPKNDLSGQRFGRLTVIAPAFIRKGGYGYYTCRCVCGTVKTVAACNLRTGSTVSCGCHRKSFRRTHGQSKTKEYRTWRSMIGRCYNKKDGEYHRYGARGIKVCAAWRHSFPTFLADMGFCPEGYSIERIDNNGDYCATNCRWATVLEQGQNKRNNRILTHNGITLTLSAWSRKASIRLTTLHSRLRQGWSVERALTEPVRGSKKT